MARSGTQERAPLLGTNGPAGPHAWARTAIAYRKALAARLGAVTLDDHTDGDSYNRRRKYPRDDQNVLQRDNLKMLDESAG